MKHHMDSKHHDKHHGHKAAEMEHHSHRMAKMKHQTEHGRGVHAHGPDYHDTASVKDSHQKGIARVKQKTEEMEVGQGGKMHWKGGIHSK